jgi:ABC-type transport system substrate-binding protein
MKKLFVFLGIMAFSAFLMSTPTLGQPQYGGTLKAIVTSIPNNIGYLPMMNADAQSRASMYAERLMDVDIKGDLVPCLAESWKVDTDNLAVTFYLRKGIKFHDGTDFNAEAARWNFQEALNTGTMVCGRYIKSIDVVDDYTIRFNLKQKNSHIVYDIWRPWIFSPIAFQKNGKDWAITHTVSASAFKVVEFQRDVVIKMEKFEDYWRRGRPYLDGIELRAVKEPATCSVMIQAGQADLWLQATPLEAAELRDKGYDVRFGISTFNNIYPDSNNPNSPFAQKKVREAVEYALDRPAMSKALGYGFTIPMNQLAPPDTSGYNPDYKGRPYDPVKAKQLLAEAGYPNGFKTSLNLLPTVVNLGTVIQNYLGTIGIEVKLDVTDPGRYWAKQFKDGWNGLHLGVAAISPEYCVAWLHHFGRDPDIKFVNLAKSPEFLAACDKVMGARDIPNMRALTRQMVTQASEDCLAIPLYTNPALTITQKYVNSTYCKDIYWTGWRIGDDWMSKK